jgi:hypothetical protein
LGLVKRIQQEGMLKSESLRRFNYRCEAAVLASRYQLARLKLHGRAAVRAPDFLGYSHSCYAFNFSRLIISLATITPEAEA